MNRWGTWLFLMSMLLNMKSCLASGLFALISLDLNNNMKYSLHIHCLDFKLVNKSLFLYWNKDFSTIKPSFLLILTFNKHNSVLPDPSRALALNCDAPLNDKDGAESRNWRAGKPVRVVRSSKGRRISKYAPEEGNRYDGIYKVSPNLVHQKYICLLQAALHKIQCRYRVQVVYKLREWLKF